MKLPGNWGTGLRVARHFLPDVLVHKRELALVLLLSVGLALLELARPWPLQWIFDAALAPTGGPHAAPLRVVGSGAAAMLGIVVLGALVQYQRQVRLASVGHQVTRSLRLALFRRLAALSPRFHARHKSGDLLMRLMGDAPVVQAMLVESAVEFATRLALIAGTLAVMFTMDPLLAAIVLAVVPALVFVINTAAARIRTAVRKQRRKEAAMADYLHEAVAGVTLIQSLGRTEDTVRRFAHSNRTSMRAGLASTRASASLALRIDGALGVALTAALGVGAWRVLGGHLTPGELLVFMSYVRSLLKPVRAAGKHSDRMARGTACGERMLEVLGSRVDVTSPEGAPDAPPAPATLRFQDVRFAYEDETAPALDGFDVTFRRGELTGLCGRSGAGKSTVAALALRLHDPQAGAVLLDGIDLRTLDVRSLRDRFGLCLQDTVLFGDTIRENLLLGRPEATDEELMEACRQAGAEEIVAALPEGLDARLGSQGVGLSGGQRRRLALARTLLRRAPIVIVDEPFAGLDRAGVAVVHGSLARLASEAIVIVISHEREHLPLFDRIVFLEQGRVAGSGTHAELMARLPGWRVVVEGAA